MSFFLLASGAMASAPESADRAAIVAAIGRGVGRAAVHEFVHQLLPKAPIHDSRDVQSYEYAFASRREQYYGEMRWNLARPLLQRVFGEPEAGSRQPLTKRPKERLSRTSPARRGGRAGNRSRAS